MRHCLPNFNLNRAKAYLVSITLLVEGSTISAQTYESASSGVPQNISELKGEEISFQNYNAYTSVERPWEYDKMLLLYNVGSGKFLNVGSYCGTHATLSEVPRPFWFQRRNETWLKSIWAYKRYPSSSKTGIDFCDELSALKKVQIGSNYQDTKNGTTSGQTTTYSYAKYNYIKIIGTNDNADSGTSLCEAGYQPNGQGFSCEKPIDFSTQKIVAQIDISDIKAQYTSGGNGELETIFSVGKDITKWSPEICDVHIYASHNTSTGKIEIRVQCVNDSYSDLTQKTILHDLEELGIKNNTIDIEISSTSIKVAGQECMPKSKDVSTENPIGSFFSNTAVQVGSAENKRYSKATYNFVKVYTTQPQTLGDTCIVKPGTYFPEGYQGNMTFQKSIDGNLQAWAVSADIELSTCIGENENVLSIGTNIAESSAGNNLLFYYNATDKKLKLHYVNDAATPIAQSVVDIASVDATHQTLKVHLDDNGLMVNGTKMDDKNDVIKNLSSPSVGSLQVGSKDASAPSHAIYQNLSATHSYPQAGEVWNGKKFMTQKEGNLSDKEVQVEMDLSTCTGKNENILSIGNAISKWGTGSGENNIHIYYTSGTLEIDAVNSTYTGSSNYRLRTTYTGVKGDIAFRLNSKGLFLTKDGEEKIVDKFGSENAIIKNLCNNAITKTLQVGSCEGNNRSHATYKKIAIMDVASAAKQFRTLSTPSNIAATSTQSKVAYVPYYNYAADGKSNFKTEAYNIDFNNGDYIEAEIDITPISDSNTNIFSIGTNIAIWGHDAKNEANNADNIHFYYLGKEDKNAIIQVAYVNKQHNDDLKKKILIRPDANGRLIMHINLSEADGLVVNNNKIYYPENENPMPSIPYDAEYAGEIIKFKHDANGEPVLDANGKYIPVKKGEEGYDTAKPIRETTSDYMWTTEDRDSEEMPVFISSRFSLESNASNNEGSFLSWAPYYEQGNTDWGSVGVYADRNLPQPAISTEQSQMTSEWYFAPVKGMENTYQIYLNMADTPVPYRDISNDKKYDYKKESGKFYLQATSVNVYGNNLENYGGGYDDEKNADEYTDVEALVTIPTGDKAEYSYWKIFNVAEYYSLFKATNSEMSTKVDLTYSMRDPDFARENEDLDNWKLDASLQGKNQTVVGFDQYTKKYDNATGSFDQDYTDDDGHKNSTSNGSEIDKGNDFYQFSKKHIFNHARYMGVEVKNGGYGKFYQEGLSISNPGWYVIRCAGLSNVGAKLFVKYQGSTLEQPLHKVTDEENAYFNATDKVWPYDQFVIGGNKTAMPLYNALVAMNDQNADNSNIDGQDCKESDKLFNKLQTQVAFYVSEEELKGGTLTVTFGIDIPQQQNATSPTSNDWTVFDNFHLEYGGDNAKDPNIVLDEDSTTLGYLDRSMHIFKDRPMRLKRTFDPNTWNTLVLPVSLTKAQFIELLDNDETAQLLKIKEIKGTKLIFTPETEETEGGTFLRANKPYLVKTSKANGQNTEYVAHIYHWADGGKTKEDVTCPAGHFATFGVTLTPVNDNPNKGEAIYDFANNAKYKTNINGETYDYVVNLGDEDIAKDADGLGRTATFYGTLCKTFDFDKDGKGYYLKQRPRLNDGKSYYMKPDGGNNFYYRKKGSSYGLKAFRCWFVYDEAQPTAAKYSIEISGVTDDTTDIEAIEASNGLNTIARYKGAIYNLNGQKVAEGKTLNQLPAGIYIVNGKKYIINK